MTRSGAYTDVRVKGQVIGYVKRNAEDGFWDAYMDYQRKAGSTLLGKCITKAQAMGMVQHAAFG